MVYYNPYITGEYNPLYDLTNQGFFRGSITPLKPPLLVKPPLLEHPSSTDEDANPWALAYW